MKIVMEESFFLDPGPLICVTRWRPLRGEAHTGCIEYNARNQAYFLTFNLYDKISDDNRLIDYVVF